MNSELLMMNNESFLILLDVIYNEEIFIKLSYEELSSKDITEQFKVKERIEIFEAPKSNISKDVYELYNFIHLGYACKVNGGCNNGSPRQEFTEFKNNNPGSESGKMIYLKLWKTRPATPAQTPDIVEKIVFQ